MASTPSFFVLGLHVLGLFAYVFKYPTYAACISWDLVKPVWFRFYFVALVECLCLCWICSEIIGPTCAREC